MQNEIQRPKIDVFRQFAEYGLRYKTRLIYIVSCSIAISVLTLMMITLLKPVMEIIFHTATTSERTGQLNAVLWWLYELRDWFFLSIEQSARDNRILTLAFVCVTILVIVFLNGVLKYIQTYMVQWIGNRVIMDIQRDLFEKMLHFNVAYYAQNKVGYLISYFTADTRVIGITVFYVFGRLMLDPILVLGTIAYLLYIQWQFTLLYALIFPAIFFAIRFFARKSRKAGGKAQEITARLGAFLQEHFSAVRLVQGYSMYPRQQNLLDRETRGVFDASMSMARAYAASSPINEFLGIFALCCILLVAGCLDFNGGDLMVYAGLLAFLYQPIKRIERAIQQIQHGLAAAERVFEALNTDAALPAVENPKPLLSFDRTVQFDRVCFSYDEKTDVLSDVDFTVRKGEQIALVGPSGAGKTTLVNLIPRFYDPTEGAIRIDGIDLREANVEDLRRLIGMVSQDVTILGDTVRLNLTCGDDSYSDERICEAAKAVCAYDFIAALPQGFDTVIGERGESLSGGQCQRVAIARAFLRDAPILILDEATSSLDSESESHIKQSLNRLMKGRTAFVIAHRLSTILQADRIFVMDCGKIVDCGRHSELLERCELYQRLYALQFNGDDSTTVDG